MSWSIGETVNTVKISNECAKELFEAQGENGEIWYNLEDVTYKGRVTFNSDHSEWMDWLAHNEELVEVLKKHKVRGDICFGSLEGDNAGSFWGYRFDGKGGMVELTGRVVYEEKREPLKDKILVVTGILDGMTREEAHRLIQEAGGTVSDSVTKKTDYLVVGNKPGSKVAKAAKLGISTLTEQQFRELLK